MGVGNHGDCSSATSAYEDYSENSTIASTHSHAASLTQKENTLSCSAMALSTLHTNDGVSNCACQCVVAYPISVLTYSAITPPNLVNTVCGHDKQYSYLG